MAAMMGKFLGAGKTVAQGVARALRARPGAALLAMLGVLALDVLLPPLLLSVTRKPWTYFTFNPWLKRLPEYLVSPAPWAEKLDFLGRVALFWFSADGDRKSTRLNSSHMSISYAVFCLKKKTKS